MRLLTHHWTAIGTTNSVTVSLPQALVPAIQLAQAWVESLDRAASRFRPDSELSRVNAAAATGPVAVHVSPVFGRCIAAALDAAAMTDGLVDPTLGDAVIAAGYDTDFATVVTRHSASPPSGARDVDRRGGWRRVSYRAEDRRLEVPAGITLDVGSVAKAAAADEIAAVLARSLPGGFIVNLGGDIATSGEQPSGGWPLGIEDSRGRILQTFAGHGQGFATSGTVKRSWATGHHIVDPRTGRCASRVWAQVTCAAATAARANAASTAAIVLGVDAPRWLTGLGLPARLDGTDTTTITTPGWPAPQPQWEAA